MLPDVRRRDPAAVLTTGTAFSHGTEAPLPQFSDCCFPLIRGSRSEPFSRSRSLARWCVILLCLLATHEQASSAKMSCPSLKSHVERELKYQARREITYQIRRNVPKGGPMVTGDHRHAGHRPGDRRAQCHTVRQCSGPKAVNQAAAHSSPRTTKLYDRTNDQITLDEVEKITL